LTRRDWRLLVVAVACSAAFILLALLVPRGALVAFDTEIMLALRELHTPSRDRMATMVTDLGWAPIVITLVCLFAAWCSAARDRAASLALIAVALANLTVNYLLKQGFQRVRPELWPRMQLESFAFPSGHAMTGVAIYGMLAIVLTRRVPKARAWVIALAPPVCLGIGFSRVYLGVHWPSDVIAGWAVGLVLMTIGVLGMARWGRNTRPTSPSMAPPGPPVANSSP
jgi:undecaprenyl-diphosphatase